MAVALTGSPRVDFTLRQPAVTAALLSPRINRQGQVPLLAGASEGDSPVTHIHEDVPESFPDGDGGSYSPDPHIHVHEAVEKWVMEHGHKFAAQLGLTPDDFNGSRVKYDIAHDRFALPAEKASVEAAGIPWQLYNAHMAGTYAGIKGKKASASPASLYRAPYEDDDALGLLKPSKDHDMNPYDISGGGSILPMDMSGMSGLTGIGMPGSRPFVRQIPASYFAGGAVDPAMAQYPGDPNVQVPPQQNPDWQMHHAAITGYQPTGLYNPMTPPPRPDSIAHQGGVPDAPDAPPEMANSVPGVTAAGGAADLPPAGGEPHPGLAASLFGPRNADLISTLGGALLGSPTLRQGLGAFGQVAPQVLAQQRKTNATIDYLNSVGGDSPYLKNPKFQAMLAANPELASQLVMPHRVWGKIGTSIDGRDQYGWTDALKGTVTDAAGNPVDASGVGSGSGGSSGGGYTPSIPVPPNPTGRSDAYDRLPDDMKGQAEAIYSGRAQLNQRGATQGAGLAISNAVNALGARFGKPYDSTLYDRRKATMANLGLGGKEDTVLQAGRTAVGHLATLSDDIEQLKQYSAKTGVPLMDYWINRAHYAAQEGTGSPLGQLLNDIDATVPKVAEETTSFYTNGGGGQSDREKAEAPFDTAKSVPELEAALARTAHLVGSKVGAIQTRYKELIPDDNTFRVLDPQSQKAFNLIQQRYAATQQAQGQSGAVQIPQGAADYLKANPTLRGAFDQKYGPGAAAQVLGQ